MSSTSTKKWLCKMARIIAMIPTMVLQDKVHAMIADYPICVSSVFRYPDAGLLSVLTPLTYEPLGIALPGNDPLLVNWVQNTLNSLEGSGRLDELKLKWFAEGSWLDQLK